jgi:23S rRNA pseudouridine1911/1915/1917 synthase
MKIIKKIVTEELKNQRLDTYVASLDLDVSRSMAQKIIKQGNVLVNGKIEKESYKTKIGDQVEVKLEEPKETTLKAEDIDLDIIYEDDDIVVVNKEKGMVVHPGNGNTEGTLVNAILNHCKGSLSGIGGEIRPGIVHRIDKDTSGLLIVAKNDKAHIDLSNQIKNHEVTKIYTALVKGNIEENEATIDMPIARSQNDRKKMAVRKDGKEAVSHLKVEKRYGKYTLIKVKIDTGRTHQIRVHMAEIKHPVVGDEVYSNGKNDFNVHGQMLHSTILEFKHPTTGEMMHLEAPLPEYFKDVLNKLDKELI